MSAGKAAGQDILDWLREERGRVAAEIDRFSSGEAQLMQRRRGRMLDVTGEKLKELRRRQSMLDRHIAELEPTAPQN